MPGSKPEGAGTAQGWPWVWLKKFELLKIRLQENLILVKGKTPTHPDLGSGPVNCPASLPARSP